MFGRVEVLLDLLLLIEARLGHEGLVYIGDVGADDDLHLRARGYVDDTLDGLDTVVGSERFVLEVESQARHAVRGGDHVALAADRDENVLRDLFVGCHGYSS